MCSSAASVLDLRMGGRWFDPRLGQYFFSRIDDSHCDKIHSSLTAVHCLVYVYVEKHAVAWKEYYAYYWHREIKKSMDRCNSHCDIIEIILKTTLKIII